MGHSTRYRIQQLVFGIVSEVALQHGARSLYNPALPIALPPQAQATRLLFVADRGDTLIEQPGQREKRRTQILVGALVRSEAGDADADALHWSARLAVRALLRERLAAAGITAPVLREGELDAALASLQTDGALLMSLWNVEYLETYAAD